MRAEWFKDYTKASKRSEQRRKDNGLAYNHSGGLCNDIYGGGGSNHSGEGHKPPTGANTKPRG